MEIKAYIHHKRAEKYSDCQDYFGIDAQNNLVAVSDGMSQSIYPQWWAKILVEAYLKSGRVPDDITPFQQSWQKAVFDEIKKRESEGNDPWRLKNCVAEKKGAGATLCGLTWREDEWECQCIGDSCLIEIKDDYSITIHTSQNGVFGNQPDYLDSFANGKGTPKTITKSFSGTQALLLVSDPFSELFQKHENDPKFIEARLDEIKKLTGHDSFVSLVEQWRDELKMHNDDSTLILLQGFSSPKADILHKDDLIDLCNNAPTSSESSTPLAQNANSAKVNNNQTVHDEPADPETKFMQATRELLQNYDGKASKGKVIGYIIEKIDDIILQFATQLQKKKQKPQKKKQKKNKKKNQKR